MKELGCYYSHIFYPSHIYIKRDSPFIFEFEGKTFFVKIIQNLKSLITNDFDNEIVSLNAEQGKLFHKLKETEIKLEKKVLTVTMKEGYVAYVLNDQKHLYSEFYTKDHTELVIFFESTKEDKNDSTALKALNYFIECYRVISGDVLTLPLSKTTHVSKVIREYFYVYTKEDLKKPESERNKVTRDVSLVLKSLHFPFWDTQGKKLQTDESINAIELENYLRENKKPNPLQEFLLKAREELHVHKNFKYSFIETWTSLEIAIVRYLRDVKLAKGISKNKVDDFESEVGISYLLNIELPLIHPSNDLKFKELIGKVDSIRKLRNKVVHQNRDISSLEAENAYQIALEFLDFMAILKIRKTQ